MVDAAKILKEDDVMDGVTSRCIWFKVEATFDDGTKLVTVHNQLHTKRSMIPGGI